MKLPQTITVPVTLTVGDLSMEMGRVVAPLSTCIADDGTCTVQVPTDAPVELYRDVVEWVADQKVVDRP